MIGVIYFTGFVVGLLCVFAYTGYSWNKRKGSNFVDKFEPWEILWPVVWPFWGPCLLAFYIGKKLSK